MTVKVLICSGDASGDLHAADFVRALRARHPETRFLGIGGDNMEKEGVELLAHQRDLAVGLLDVFSSAGRILSAFSRLGRALREAKPDLVVLVDSPDFNIPFSRKAARAGVPILYYVSPQVWAWRRGRIAKIARRVDRLAVIFPFEQGIYAGTGLQVDFVGHPLLERVASFREGFDRDAFRAAMGVAPDSKLVLLMPGSRRNEMAHHLTLFLEVAQRLHAEDSTTCFALAVAPTLDLKGVEEAVRAAGLPAALALQVVQGKSYALMAAADLALAKPGTSTMELALFGCPFVVAGRGPRLTWLLSRIFVQVPALAMPSLIAGAPIVPEFIQDDARADRIATACSQLIDGPARVQQLERLAAVVDSLGQGGAAARTAAIAEEMIGGLAQG